MNDWRSTNFIWKGFYRFLGFLDTLVYTILNWAFDIFFNIAGANFLDSDTITNFYSRLQLLIGIFVVFKLSVNLVSGLVDPDKVTDKKSGASNIIISVMISLTLLTLTFPLSGIPDSAAPKNSYNRFIKTQGIIFGTLSSLQKRIIDGNVLGKLFLGVNGTETDGSVSSAANEITTAIAKGFVYPNGQDGDTSKWVCNGNKITTNGSFGDSGSVNSYYSSSATYADVFKAAGYECPSTFGSDNYQFAYLFIVSTAVGVFCIFVVISFSLDVAVRLLKLTILRFLAPIPIIAYIDPKTREQSFKPWLKMLGNTYLDLFLRLGLIYFIVFVCRIIIEGDLEFTSSNGFLNFLSLAVILVALLFFAKQAPKFIKEIFGIKDEGKGMFSGFGAIAGVGALGLGAVGAFRTGRQASIDADHVNEVHPNTWLGRRANNAKHLLSGITGGVTGVASGVSALNESKDHHAKSVLNAFAKHNDTAIAKGESGSTFGGRLQTTFSKALTGSSQATINEREIARLEQQKNALDAIKSRVSSEMVKSDTTSSAFRGNVIDTRTGNVINGTTQFNYKDTLARMNAAKASGRDTVDIYDMNGGSYTISMVDAEKQIGNLLAGNEDSYFRQMVANGGDAELTSLITDAQRVGVNNSSLQSRTAYKDASESLGITIRNQKRSNETAKANDMFTGK